MENDRVRACHVNRPRAICHDVHEGRGGVDKTALVHQSNRRRTKAHRRSVEHIVTVHEGGTICVNEVESVYVPPDLVGVERVSVRKCHALP